MAASTDDSERFVAPRKHRLWLFARFPEPVPVEFYRLVARLRVIVLSMLMVANLALASNLTKVGYDEAFYWLGMAVNTPIITLAIILGLLMWRGDYGGLAMRRMNFACLLLEIASVTPCRRSRPWGRRPTSTRGLTCLRSRALPITHHR